MIRLVEAYTKLLASPIHARCVAAKSTVPIFPYTQSGREDGITSRSLPALTLSSHATIPDIRQGRLHLDETRPRKCLC